MSHTALVKVAIDDDGDEMTKMARVIIQCADCAGSIRIELPAVHLATLGNACAAAALARGITARTETVAEFGTPTSSEVACDAALNVIRGKASMN